MPGYWSMLEQQPNLIGLGAGIAQTYLAAKRARQEDRNLDLVQAQQELTKAKNDQLGEQEKAKIEFEKGKYEAEQLDIIKKRTAAVLQRLSQMTPEQRTQAAPWLDRMVQSGQIEAPQMEQLQSAAPLEAAAYDIKQPDSENVSLDPIARQVILGYNLNPGQPGFSEKYNELTAIKAAQDAAKAKASRVQVNVGEKQLPTASVTDIADADSALESIDLLLESFVTSVPSGSTAENIGARVSAMIPNTDVNVFNTERNIATQIVGSFLEGGVLKEQDFKRYNNMMPTPGDSLETAQKKVAILKKMISSRQSRRRQQLGAAGYKVPQKEQTTTQEPPPYRLGDPGGVANIDEIISTLASDPSPVDAANRLVKLGVITEDQKIELLKKAHAKRGQK